MRKYLWLLVVVVLAGILRFANLTGFPPALISDEVAIGYNAYSILKTGKDEYGIRYPLTFRSFDDYKMPVDVYMIAGSMQLFGPMDFSVRFPSALFGTLTVLLTYFLVRELWRQDGHAYGLAASFLLAVSPWSVLFSRAGYGSNVAVFFSVAGVYLALCGFRRGWLLVLSSIAFSLSIWSYHSFRIFIPLMLVGLAVLYSKKLIHQKIPVIVAVVLAGIMLFPLVQKTFSIEGRMRAIGVSAFANPDDIKRTISMTLWDKVHGLDAFALLHNRRIQYTETFLRGYFSHFDLNFLFLDKSIERYRAPGVGLMYLFELPFLFIGLYQLFRTWSPESGVIVWWLVTAPVAAAFTLQFPHPGRAETFLPAFQIITAVGIIEAVRKAASKWKYMLLVAIIMVSVIYFIHQYFVHLPVLNAPYWYVGRKEMTQKIVLYENEYDKIFVSNALDFPYIFYLYYRPVDPAAYQMQGGTVSGGFLEQNNRFGKVEFRSISTSQRDPLKKILFVGLPGEVFKTSLIVDTIYYPDKSEAIVFFE